MSSSENSKVDFYDNFYRDLENIKSELSEAEEKMMQICDQICKECYENIGSLSAEALEKAVEVSMALESGGSMINLERCISSEKSAEALELGEKSRGELYKVTEEEEVGSLECEKENDGLPVRSDLE
ncbi:hypothetical protein D915_008185 [Fasciola hepatica]|uniref:Uncharacterized protein n=1 Tax=Fasciola hepatica TaxID=6192 RepID=A0A4E0R132_FASHE|nr:hypothetical protein D915_008185 [Fasciola hepatica]